MNPAVAIGRQGRRQTVRVAATLVAAGLVLMTTGCGDGTPGFCTDLERQADMRRLAAALDAGNLPRASAEANRFRKLADTAPEAVRPDLEALANGLADVVDVLREQQAGAAPTALERRRDQLNARLAELGRRGRDVAAWASRECGLDL